MKGLEAMMTTDKLAVIAHDGRKADLVAWTTRSGRAAG